MLGQNNKTKLYLAAIILMTVFSIGVDFPEFLAKTGLVLPNWLTYPFHLGLDLQGGTQLVYEADLKSIPLGDQASAVEGVRDVIERRVNAFGVAEPVIQTTQTENGWRIIAELAGVSDVNQAIKMIGETPLLEFKKQNPNPTANLTPEQTQEIESYNADAKNRAEALLVQTLKSGANFAELATAASEDGSKVNGGDLDFMPRGALVKEFETVCFDELKVGETAKKLIESQFGYHIIKKTEEKGSGDSLQARCSHILIKTKNVSDYITENDQWLYTGLTGKQLKRAQVSFDPNTQVPMVNLEFDDEGKDLFGNITKTSVGQPVAIFLDNQVISAPVVQEPILDGKAVVSGNFTIKQAKTLAQRLNAGALPVPINLISQQTVGASLGNESMTKSLKAGLLGLALICIFMVLFYRLPGLTASICLLFYTLVLLAIFKLIPITLTLSGIAGFILSLGMAVDANVLIFERLKEEIKAKKPLRIALDEGFRRAWSAIFDGNVSTLLSCVILIGFTSSMVKGFAITLSIGILVSMFSAVIVNQLILNQLLKIKKLNQPWLFGGKRKISD